MPLLIFHHQGEVIQIAVALLLPENRLVQAGVLEQLLWWASPSPLDASPCPVDASPCPVDASPCPVDASPCPVGASPCPTSKSSDHELNNGLTVKSMDSGRNTDSSTVSSVRFALWLFGGALFYRGVR